MQKLELTWIGKGSEPAVEPRILLHDASKDYGDPAADNMLIHGDNLLALKALEQEFAGRVKCIYIDPPYNTGEAFEEYDDNLEHSIWLHLMNSRLKILHTLLSKDGVIFVQLNDEEMNYCKVLLDEIFGRNNMINLVSVRTKNTSGASGGGEDKRLKKNVEYILIYAKDYVAFPGFNDVFEETDLFDLINDMREEGKSWKYTRVLTSLGTRTFWGDITDGSGATIKVFKHSNVEMKSISEIAREIAADRKISLEEAERQAYIENFEFVFRDTNAQSSIRQRVMDATGGEDGFYSIEYYPQTGRNKGTLTTLYYKGPKRDIIAWLKDVAYKTRTSIVKREKLGTYWGNFNWNNVNKEGGVVFTGGKKPEQLLQRIIEMASNPGDIILDSFLGSGTTAATAHKLGRRYIGVELGEHCYTLCLPRLQRVVDGDQTGISPSIGWQGGGGFKFYELAPTLIVKDKHGNPIIDTEKYNPEMLAAAVAKLNGFAYAPDPEVFWKQGKNVENSYIYVTTQYLTAKALDDIARDLPDYEKLLICAPAFDIGLGKRYENIDVRKIPQSVLNKCEFGADNYNLNIVNPPELDEEEWDDAEQ